jgi:hypothetical protein
MTTAVVVATVVQTKMSEADLRNAVQEPVRDHEQNLLAALTGADGEANIATAILNLEEFMKYMVQRFPRAADTPPAARSEAKPKLTVATGAGSEIDFMNQLLEQMEAGSHPPTVGLSEADLLALEEEAIGEHFGRNAFLY